MNNDLESRVVKLETIVDGLRAALGGVAHTSSVAPNSGSRSGTQPASDAELDGKYGAPAVRKDPTAKYWSGVSYVGKKLSECPSDYLRAYAKYKEACAYMGERNANGDEQKLKYARYDRSDAARALGWAARNEGKVFASHASVGAFSDAADDVFGYGASDADDSDIPFIRDASYLRWDRP